MRADAGRLATAAGLAVERCEHFNLAGAAGWLVNHVWMKKTRLPPGQTLLFDKLVPFFKLIDRVALGRAGLSLLMVLKKG